MNPQVPCVYPTSLLTNVGWAPDGHGGETPVVCVQVDGLITLIFSEDDAHAFISQIQLAIYRMKEPE